MLVGDARDAAAPSASTSAACSADAASSPAPPAVRDVVGGVGGGGGVGRGRRRRVEAGGGELLGEPALALGAPRLEALVGRLLQQLRRLGARGALRGAAGSEL